MEPVVAILAVFVLFPAVVFSGIIRLKRLKMSQGAPPAPAVGEGLRVSELKAIVEDAVEKANAPLRKRIEGLEAIATSDASRYLADPSDAEDDAVGAAPRARTRA